MASYDAVVNLNVVGTSRLERVSAAIGQLNSLTRQLNSNLNLLSPGAGKLGDNLRKAFEPIKNFAREAQNGTAQLANTLAGASAQANVFATALDNVKLKAGGITSQEATVKNLAEAWVQTTLNANEYQKRLDDIIATSLQTKGLMQLGGGQIVRGTEAGVGIQGPKLPPELGGGLNLPPGTTKLAPPKLRGLQGKFATQPGLADAILGGAFPLLFGGGPGAVAGGFAGGLAGGAIGGPLGMALSVGLSAAGQQLDVAFKESLKLVTEIGTALKTLNLDKLRDSCIAVNSELEVTIQRLAKAGQGDAARAAIAKQVTLQTGLLPEAVTDIANNTKLLTNTWNEFLAAVSGTLTIIATPFVSLITLILQGLAKTLQAFNLIATAIGSALKRTVEWAAKTLGLGELLEKLKVKFNAITGENEKQYASAVELTDQLDKELRHSEKLLGIEKQKTLGRTLAEKQINAALEYRVAKENILYESAKKQEEIQMQLAATTDARAQKELKLALDQTQALEAQALRNQEIKDLLVQQGFQIEANTKKYETASTAVEKQIASLERGNQVTQSRYSAEAALNDLYGAQLQRQYDLATTTEQRFNIAIAMFNQQVKAAQIEFNQALSSNALLVEKAKLEANLVAIKYKQLEAEKLIAIAQAKSRGNTPAQIQDISKAYDQGLQAQQGAVQQAFDQVKASEEIAKNQNAIANAVYKTKIIQAESNLAQKLTTEEIGLSATAANNLAGVLGQSAVNANNLAASMGRVAVQASNAAQQMQNAQNLRNMLRGGGNMNAGAPAYASGGYVTGPTRALIGEGSQPEYIIPENKMGAAMARYAAGQRGESVIPNGNTTGAAGDLGSTSINPMINVTTGPVMNMNGSNYVSQNDFVAGMQAASRRGAEMALSAMQNNAGIRRAVGAR